MKNTTFDQVKINFEKFLSLINNVLTCEKEINIIKNKLRRHFNTTTSDYLCSNEFISSLNHIQNLFVENKKSTKFFTLLASFDEQLKKNSIKLSKPNPLPTKVFNCSSPIATNTQQISLTENIEISNCFTTTESTIEYNVSISTIQETIEYLLEQCCNIVSETDQSKSSRINKLKSTSTGSNGHLKNQQKINKLERRLSRLSRIIRELEEKDMSLDEMVHCDLYVVESNLKKQACELHAKLARLKSQSTSVERIIYQPITLNESETGHSLINKDLQDMVNQSKHFPSFRDVLDIVEKANDKYKLNLNEEKRRNIAEKSFKVIGKEIKTRRMADFNDIMLSRLPDDFNIEQDDPALNSAEIEKVLIENNREARIRTEKIFEEFSQIEPDPSAEVNIESTDESENESDEEHDLETLYESNEIQQNTTDVPPSPLLPESTIPSVPQTNSIEATVEISLNNRTLTILSTASLPIKRTTHNQELKISNNNQTISNISNESNIETLIPRRKQTLNDNEIIYKLYRQRLTNESSPERKPIDNKKRSFTNDMNYSNVKKSKQQSEIIVLD